MSDPIDRLSALLANRYRIERELGRGGMATVYLAEDLRHHRHVAVKVMRPELAETIGPDRFLREIEIAAQLHHPHILPLYDSGQADGFLFYVMPYEDGQSLRQRMQREGELPVGDAVRLLADVVDALSHAHRHGVVHRDIKPENILLSDHHAFVTDFGVAKALSEAARTESLTTAGMALGTPAYMAPEQAAADPSVDHRADLYAVGATAYEMLTGEPPFQGPPQAVLLAHLTDQPAPISERREAIPPQLARLVMQCLSKKPADRPQAAEEMLPVLQGLATPSSGTQPTVVRSTGRFGARIVKRWMLGAAAVAVALVGFILTRSSKRDLPRSQSSRTAIAVLPFQNLSADPSRAYFASGLHDELLTQLTKVAALRVISRTSVEGYEGSGRGATAIAAELGVGTIVEGSVQTEGNRLRVNVQLIDGVTDEHLWAERYDRTLDDVFAVQSEVAQQIVLEVGAVLGAGEQEALTDAPTHNAEAYRLYLQCRDYLRRPGYLRENFEIAQQLCERAIHLDSTFVLAYAVLSDVHGRMYWERYDPSPARLAQQRHAAETALRLAPSSPMAHAAMGTALYYGRDFRAGLQEYRTAVRGLPNDAQLWSWVGFVERRLGNWDESIDAYERAVALDPRDATLYNDLGAMVYDATRQYDKAVEAFDQALSLAPDFHMAAVLRAHTFVRWMGTLDTLRRVLQDMPAGTDIGSLGSRLAQRVFLLRWERQPDSLLVLMEGAHGPRVAGQEFFFPIDMVRGWAHEMRGDVQAARVAFAFALDTLDAVVVTLPDARVHGARGLVLAALGRKTEALEEARWLADSPEYREDAFQGTVVVEDRAAILARLGETAAALEEIERLLSSPSWLSVPLLRLDPRWDEIRDDRRFEQLLERYGASR